MKEEEEAAARAAASAAAAAAARAAKLDALKREQNSGNRDSEKQQEQRQKQPGILRAIVQQIHTRAPTKQATPNRLWPAPCFAFWHWCEELVVNIRCSVLANQQQLRRLGVFHPHLSVRERWEAMQSKSIQQSGNGCDSGSKQRTAAIKQSCMNARRKNTAKTLIEWQLDSEIYCLLSASSKTQ